MALEGTNVWSNFFMAVVLILLTVAFSTLSGADYFFVRCTKSPKNNIRIYTHPFYTNHLGKPAGLKYTSKIGLVEA